MSCYTYVLECKDGSYYTGIASNPRRRTKEHNLRIRSCLQKCKIPARIVYLEKFETRKEAARREKEIKGWSRKKKNKLINEFKLGGLHRGMR